MKSQQSGFAHAFLIIGLVIALAGALGFVYWQNFIYEAPATAQAEVIKTQTKEDESKIKTGNDNYFRIDDWGIKTKIFPSLNDTELTYKVYDENSIGVVTSRVKTILDSCKYEDTAGGSQNVSMIIVRSKNKSEVLGSSDDPKLLNDAPINEYYYARSGWLPATTCNSSQVELQKDDANALFEMFKGIESTN